MNDTEKYTECQHRDIYRTLREFLELQPNAQDISTIDLWNQYCDWIAKRPNRNGRPVQITDIKLILDMLHWIDSAKSQPKEILEAFGKIDEAIW